MRDHQRYNRSAKGKARSRKYDQTEEGRARKKRYRQSGKGRAADARNNAQRVYAGEMYLGRVYFTDTEIEEMRDGKTQ